MGVAINGTSISVSQSEFDDRVRASAMKSVAKNLKVCALQTTSKSSLWVLLVAQVCRVLFVSRRRVHTAGRHSADSRASITYRLPLELTHSLGLHLCSLRAMGRLRIDRFRLLARSLARFHLRPLASSRLLHLLHLPPQPQARDGCHRLDWPNDMISELFARILHPTRSTSLSLFLSLSFCLSAKSKGERAHLRVPLFGHSHVNY